VDTSDDWILTRTGIRERRIAGPGETAATLATEAARAALADAGLAPSDIDLLVVATCTPDLPMPSTACLVQTALGLPERAACLDLNAACTGFVYALDTAWALLASGRYHHALVVGADKMSAYVDWSDRATCVLFGDGAGAVLLQATDQPRGLLASNIGAWGEGEALMAVDAGGTREPATAERLDAGRQYVYMNGREIFKHAVRGMAESSERAVADAGFTLDDVALVVPHQANVRIIEAVAKRLGVPMERFFVNLDRYGNTSAASVPIALYEAAAQGRVRPGDLVLLTAFGGGLTWGSALLRWGH
jgi:3-oxoacyl-[acyl-carrier-protein] synthase III